MKITNYSTQLIFNHFYKLRHDKKRSFLYSTDVGFYNSPIEVNESWLSKIHPIYAMIFSFLSEPISISDLIKELAYFFNISEEDSQKLIIPILEQNQAFFIEYQGVKYNFPANVIIPAFQAYAKPKLYSPSQFQYDEIDMESDRYYNAPLTAVLMLNNKCVTSCAYCYADTTTKNKNLPFEQLKKVLKNAYDLGVMSISLTGGEVFLYKKLPELLKLFSKYDYPAGLLSTKVPLTEEKILSVKPYNPTIQISLDGLEDCILIKILNVKEGYTQKVKEGILLLEKHEVRFQIATVLTIYNDNIENLEKIYSFIKDFKHLHRWDIRLAFRSLYSRGNFDKIKVKREKIEYLDKWITAIQAEKKINISWDPVSKDHYFESTKASKGFVGARCSANYSNIFILPDGKVTVCEQLYWKSQYIIGDLSYQTIEEVWNSPKALQLAFPKRDDFREQSVCKKCNQFDECYTYSNKCIVDVIKGYGEENADYPDPRCIKAPAFIYELRN